MGRPGPTGHRAHLWQPVDTEPAAPNGSAWRRGFLHVLVLDIAGNWLVSISTSVGLSGRALPTDEQIEAVRHDLRLQGAEEWPAKDEVRYLVLPILPEQWPWDTIAAEFDRDTIDSPWRLRSLFADGQYDGGWNSDQEASMYALTGSGFPPYIHKFAAGNGFNSLHAVWPRLGWCAGWEAGRKPADPAELGYLVLDELPDIPLQECGGLLWCQTCDEPQDADALCDHVWWCRDGAWCGAVDDPGNGCDDEHCECADHGGALLTRQLVAAAALGADVVAMRGMSVAYSGSDLGAALRVAAVDASGETIVLRPRTVLTPALHSIDVRQSIAYRGSVTQGMPLPEPPIETVDFTEAASVVGLDAEGNEIAIDGPVVVLAKLPAEVARLRWTSGGGE